MNRPGLLLFATTLLLTTSSAWAAKPRFVDLNDGTILDVSTRTRWLKNASCFAGVDGRSLAPYFLKSGQCGLTDGTAVVDDWRVPSLDILRTLVVDGFRADSLNAAGFVGFQAGGYWASDVVANTTRQWTLSFADGREYPIVWSSSSMNHEPYCTRYFNYLDVAPMAADFGAVAVNATSDSRTFSLQNLGGGDDDYLSQTNLDVTEIAIVGADSDQFTLDAGNGSEYRASGTGACGPQPIVHHVRRETPAHESIRNPAPCTINIAFAPTSPGRKSATLRITAPNAKNPVVELPLSGNALVSWWKAEGDSLDSLGSNHGTFNATSVLPSSASAAENGTATAWCPAGATIASFSSTYGNGTRVVTCGDCTIGAQSCTVTYSNAGCGDPWPGAVKVGTLTLQCADGYATGKIGRAFSFDGSNPLAVTVPHSLTLDLYGGHTVAFWIKLNALPPAGKLFYPVSKLQFGVEDKRVAIDSAGKVSYYLYGTTGALTVSSTALVPGTWYHVAATYDGTARRVFINGVLDAIGPSTGDVADGTGALYLGYSPDWSGYGSAAYFDGLLDEVKWYSHALPQSEIARTKVVEKVTVTTSGFGGGTVVAQPAPLTWSGTTGTLELPAGSALQLEPRPDATSAFAGWSSICSGRVPCSLTVDSDLAVAATFDPIVGVNGLAIPAAGGMPQAVGGLTPISDRYRATNLLWSPADAPFVAGTAYTATIVLTSVNDYAFPATGLTPAVNVGTAGPGTTTGTYTGNTLTFTVTFAPTCSSGFVDTTGTGCVACDTVGACGSDCAPCAATNAASTSCSDNIAISELACVPTCSAGFFNIDRDGRNGCEACLTATFCGSDCGECTASGLVATGCSNNDELAASACSPTCAEGYLDLNDNTQDGCEACSIAAACGSDCAACSSDGASATDCSGHTALSASACVPTCAVGFQEVDGNGQNGCEPCSAIELCGRECDACSSDGTSATNCSGNTASSDLACVPTCAAGFQDANGDGRDGCESCAAGYYETASTPLTCRACNTHNHCGPGCLDCTALPVDECHAPPACDVAAGQCVLEQAPDGTDCTGGTCQDGACTASVDAGIPDPDAGESNEDAGESPEDAGTSAIDAGTSTADAGTPALDAGTSVVDAGSIGAEATPDASGCGCSSGAGPISGAPLLLALAFLRRRGRTR